MGGAFLFLNLIWKVFISDCRLACSSHTGNLTGFEEGMNSASMFTCTCQRVFTPAEAHTPTSGCVWSHLVQIRCVSCQRRGVTGEEDEGHQDTLA